MEFCVDGRIRVLLIAPSFPPMRAARPFQMGMVSRALSDFGCEVCVLAAAEEDGEALDAAKRAVGCRVEYIAVDRHKRRLAIRANTWLERYAFLASSRHRSFCACAVRKARDIIESFKPDILLTVHYPISAHCVGEVIKREYPGLPWIAFFSDPWPSGILPVPYRRSVFLLPYERRRLRRILQLSDAIAVTSRYAVRCLEVGAMVNVGHRAFLLPHCGTTETRERPGKCSSIKAYCNGRWLFHAGSLDGPRESVPLLSAVRQVAKKCPSQFSGLVIAGEGDDGRTVNLATRVGAEEYVRAIGSVSREAVLQLCSYATCNLVVEASMPESPFLPSKFADCAVLGRPILAVSPPRSEIRELFDQFGGGVAVKNDEDEIAGALQGVFLGPEGVGQCGTGLAEYFLPKTVSSRYFDMFSWVLARQAGKKGGG